MEKFWESLAFNILSIFQGFPQMSTYSTQVSITTSIFQEVKEGNDTCSVILAVYFYCFPHENAVFSTEHQ